MFYHALVAKLSNNVKWHFVPRFLIAQTKTEAAPPSLEKHASVIFYSACSPIEEVWIFCPRGAFRTLFIFDRLPVLIFPHSLMWLPC